MNFPRLSMKDFLLPILGLLIGLLLWGVKPAGRPINHFAWGSLPEMRTKVVLDTPQPVGGGQDSVRKKTEKCTCPPVVPDYTPEQVLAQFGTSRYDTLAINQSITSPDKRQETIRREVDRRERRLAKLRDKTYFQAMKVRLRDLDSLRLKACCLIVYLEREMVERTHPEMQKRRKLQILIGKNWGMLNTDMQIMEEQRGGEAVKETRRIEAQFRNLEDSNALAYLEQPEIKQTINNLKENIFFSKMSPNVNCQGGVGNLLKGISAEALGNVAPTAGCVGYTISLGKTYNLIIVKLSTGQTIAIVWDKTSEGYFGAVKLI